VINVRKAKSENALECAVIVNNWISKTKEMPKLFSKIELEQMIKEAIPLREVWLVFCGLGFFNIFDIAMIFKCLEN
tara:strand:- start:955 stop:1182 length:228 start_codon:yes stop_codon:yes gene_type:complete